MHIERIFKDDNIWKVWVSKLKAFYDMALLPELASPREGKSPGIREPGVWFDDSLRKSVALKRRHTEEQSGATCSSYQKRRDTLEQVGASCSGSHIADSVQQSQKRISVSRTKFLGRRISHEWKLSEDSAATEWFPSTVTAVLSGNDGTQNAVYEVLYDGDDEPYEVDHLVEDYRQSAVKFIDI